MPTSFRLSGPLKTILGIRKLLGYAITGAAEHCLEAYTKAFYSDEAG
jgi:hypothetical protein